MTATMPMEEDHTAVITATGSTPVDSSALGRRDSR